MSTATIAAPTASTQPALPRVVRKPTHARLAGPLTFHAAPTLYAATAFAAGIALAHCHYTPTPLLLVAASMAVIVTFAATKTAPRLALVPLTLTAILTGVYCAQIQPHPAPQNALILSDPKAPLLIKGLITRTNPIRQVESSAPFSQRTEQEQSQTLDLEVTVPDHTSRLGLRLTLYSPANTPFPSFTCGQTLQLSTPVHPPERYNDPGVWDTTAYLLTQGIGAIASAKASAVTLLASPAHPSLPCTLHQIQQSASARVLQLSGLNRNLPSFLRLTEEDAGMLAAMITGDRTWLQRRTRIGFERTGSFHLLVVSGLHLAIFAGIILTAARRLRLPHIWASLLTIAAAAAYAVFTGLGQPVQRSFWMVTLYLVGRLLWRERSPLNAIGFAALCLLAAKPDSLFEAGFQMTLLSVLAIAGIAAPIAERTFAPYLRATRRLGLIALDPALPPRIAQFRVTLRLLASHLKPLLGSRLANQGPATLIRVALQLTELLLVSITVELVMSLPMALYFHRITVLALPVNFLIVPFLGLLLPAALTTFAAQLVSPSLAAIPAAATAALLHSVVGLIHAFSNLHTADLRLPGPSNPARGVYIALLATAIFAARLRNRRLALATTAAALTLAAFTALAPQPIHRKPNTLEITAIDVGQGDSILVVTPNGKTLLIDAGGSPFGPPPGLANFDIGEDVVSAYLWSRGIRRLDALALTHAHADHIGGMPAVLANFRPREIWLGNNPHSTAYDAFLHDALTLGVTLHPCTAPAAFPFGETAVEVLSPSARYQPGPAPSNNDSLVLRIQYGQTSALLEGDAEAPSEAQMLANPRLHANLLKIGHHGSRTSSTPPFLSKVAPQYAVISVGRRNFYGHPRIEVLDELQSAHIQTWRTDALGLSTFYLDGTQVFPAQQASIRQTSDEK